MKLISNKKEEILYTEWLEENRQREKDMNLVIDELFLRIPIRTEFEIEHFIFHVTLKHDMTPHELRASILKINIEGKRCYENQALYKVLILLQVVILRLHFFREIIRNRKGCF